MLKIGICDDDQLIINELKVYLKEYEEVDIKTYTSGEELLLEREEFDIIFLDIDMKGINGIETGKGIRRYDKNVKIIYVTSFKDYTNLAFQVHAFNYLQKPINKEEIYKQLEEVKNYQNTDDEKIEFVTLDGKIRVSVKDIYFFEYMNRKVNMVTKKGVYVLKEKITDIAKMMKEFDFVMPHKSFTVNLFNVKSVKGYDVIMMEGSIIPLSQKKSVEFREELNKYLQKHILSL